MAAGTRVCLQGLNAAQLNGAQGKVVGPLEKGRYPVQLLSPASVRAAYPAAVCVKLENLNRVHEKHIEHAAAARSTAASIDACRGGGIGGSSTRMYSTRAEAPCRSPAAGGGGSGGGMQALPLAVRRACAERAVHALLQALDADLYPAGTLVYAYMFWFLFVWAGVSLCLHGLHVDVFARHAGWHDGMASQTLHSA